MTTNFRIPTKARLLAAINENSKDRPLLLSDVVFGTPVAVDLHQRNTKITITANSNTKRAMKRTLFYNRVPLSRYFLEIVGDELAPNEATNTHELLPFIYDQKLLTLDTDEIVLASLSPTASSAVLTATNNSLGWLGSVTLRYISLAPMRGFALDDGSLFGLDGGANFLLDDDGILIFNS